MTICLAYAPTAPGDAALRHCVRVAGARACDVVVVNAAREWDDTTPAEITAEQADRLADVMAQAGISWRWHDGPHGLSGGDEVITAAESPDVDLVVIGVTDRSHVEKRIVSDTTKHVLLDAPCDVLAVRVEHEV